MMRCGFRNLDVCEHSLSDHTTPKVHDLILSRSSGGKTRIPLAQVPIDQDFDRLTYHGRILSQGKLILQSKYLP